MTKQAFQKFVKVQNKPMIGKISGPCRFAVSKKWILVALPIVVSIAFQLYVSNMVAGDGAQIAQIDAQIDQISRSNKLLKEEIAAGGSLQKIEAQSSELGMVKPANVLYMAPDMAIGKPTTNTAFVDIRNNQ